MISEWLFSFAFLSLAGKNRNVVEMCTLTLIPVTWLNSLSSSCGYLVVAAGEGMFLKMFYV